jgi:chromosome partitioning protein
VYAIAIMNQKGGVGKTATTLNLGGALAELGYRVLLVDLDPQGHLTEAAGLAETPAPATLAQAMLDRWQGDVHELVTNWRPNLDAIPTNLDMFLLEPALYQERGREYRLARVLEPLAEEYDVVLVDCPPSLGALTDNALVFTKRAAVPVQSEDSTLRALRLLLEQVASLNHALRMDVEVAGLVVNLYDARRGRVVTSVMEQLQAMTLPILAVIQDRKEVREAWRDSKPVVEYAPGSPNADAYRGLAKAFIDQAAQ